MLELLENLGFNVKDYAGFSINEVDAMFTNTQLDMLITHETNETKVYVKYYVAAKQTAKQIRPQVLDDIIEDLFTIETVLTKRDTLIIIIDDEPNETIIKKMQYLYDNAGIFVVIHNIQRLQFNVLKHNLVPNHRILDQTEHDALMQKYNLNDISQLPEISRFDPPALAICMRPGQICIIERESPTALLTNYYRVCVNANV